MNSTYVRTVDVGQEPDRKAVSVVNINGQEISVSWWPSLIQQWGKEETKAYIEAEALVAIGLTIEGRTKVEQYASGHISDTEDTRNWAQRWIDEHADVTVAEPPSDPLM